MPHTLARAETAAALDAVRVLIPEYLLGLEEPEALVGIEGELARLPGAFAPPAGLLLLAGTPAAPLGCLGVRPFPLPDACELKRFYVRQAARGTGLGHAMLAHALAFARGAGYARMLLDTRADLLPAQAVYRRAGFTPIPAYHRNGPDPLLYFGLDL